MNKILFWFLVSVIFFRGVKFAGILERLPSSLSFVLKLLLMLSYQKLNIHISLNANIYIYIVFVFHPIINIITIHHFTHRHLLFAMNCMIMGSPASPFVLKDFRSDIKENEGKHVNMSICKSTFKSSVWLKTNIKSVDYVTVTAFRQSSSIPCKGPPGREQGCRHCLEKKDKKGKEDEVDPAVM